MAAATRVRVRVEGTVQGVGFRPYVYRLAGELGLGGFVLNDERGVLAEVEGDAEAVERFLERLPAEPPPLATDRERRPRGRCRRGGETRVRDRQLRARGRADTPVSPDSATCADCLRELFDPGDRRFRYPFVNCTNCGPRFTIVRGVPYDRPLTTMAGFVMCAACQAEYEDPGDRRFHAQPNACPECGPRARLADRESVDARSRVRPMPSRRRQRRCARARSWPSRVSAATTWRASPPMRALSPPCARASTARTSHSR